jgi:2-polyprenyl-3-methyl-5-hydroxy-6-metoxy-1,4-benzoquinol methylase
VKPLERIRSEFDEIARLGVRLADVLGPHEAALLRAVPDGAEAALDVGCGAGAAARRLAERCRRVVAIDLSEEMIALARARSTARANVEYHVAEAGEWLERGESYDVIVTFAVLHHMDVARTVGLMARALRPGGLLLVVDLLDRSGWRYLAIDALAFCAGAARALRRGLPSLALRHAWRDHGRGETYLTLRQARDTFDRLLPGCLVRGHLLWRYSVVWRKPLTATPAPRPS